MAPSLPTWAGDLLRTARVGRLATADAHGCPLVVPVCFCFDGNTVYSLTSFGFEPTGEIDDHEVVAKLIRWPDS